MTIKHKLKTTLCVFCLANSEMSLGESLNLNIPEEVRTIAAAEQNSTSQLTSDPTATKKPNFVLQENNAFEESWFTGNKTHKYLALASLACLGVTIIAPKKEGGIHEHFAVASAALAGAAVGTGFVYHWDDFDFDEGLKDPDNLHVLLAGLGTLGIMYAASIGPDSPHQGVGMLGGMAMGVGVKLTW